MGAPGLVRQPDLCRCRVLRQAGRLAPNDLALTARRARLAGHAKPF